MVIVAIIAAGCFALVAHAATDWDDLKCMGLQKNVPLEPPEYGQEDSAVKATAGPAVAQWEDEAIPASTSIDSSQNIKLNLRI